MSRCSTGYEDARQIPSPDVQHQQYANLPAALLNTLKREKKPFTYTPGGVNLSEVLEARLQKRIERKKKYREEQEQETKLLVVAPTYNSPLNMYSVENALETLEVQAQMASGHSPSSSTLPRNYKFKFQEDPDAEPPQSKAFRVLQIMTDTDSYSESKKQKDSPSTSEMRWSGLREGRPSNPSRFFHTLQKMTGTDAQEEQGNNTTFQKQITLNQAAPPFAPVPTASMDAEAHPALSFGSAPKLRRPAAFLPKQQPWTYTRMPAVTPVGTDF